MFVTIKCLFDDLRDCLKWFSLCLNVNDPVLCQRFASVVVRIWLGGFRHKCLDDESCLGALILSEIYIEGLCMILGCMFMNCMLSGWL